MQIDTMNKLAIRETPIHCAYIEIVNTASPPSPTLFSQIRKAFLSAK
jgi:hypothetical protein